MARLKEITKIGSGSDSDHWCTPKPVVEAVHEFFGGEPMLDPCSNVASIMGGTTQFWGPPGQDGLVIPWRAVTKRVWHGRKRLTVFVNPPYSAKLDWVKKCAEEHDADRSLEILALLPSDTDTRWFHQYGMHCRSLCFWRGRLTFIGNRSDTAMFPSVLLYWGANSIRFRRVFSGRGWCIRGYHLAP